MDEVGRERIGGSACRRVGVRETCAGSIRRYAHTPTRSPLTLSPFKLLQDVQRLDQVSAH
jgi:hypothetical protein